MPRQLLIPSQPSARPAHHRAAGAACRPALQVGLRATAAERPPSPLEYLAGQLDAYDAAAAAAADDGDGDEHGGGAGARAKRDRQKEKETTGAYLKRCVTPGIQAALRALVELQPPPDQPLGWLAAELRRLDGCAWLQAEVQRVQLASGGGAGAGAATGADTGGTTGDGPSEPPPMTVAGSSRDGGVV